MFVKELKSKNQISFFLGRIVSGQLGFEQHLNKISRKQNGVFLTNSLSTVENVLSVIDIKSDIFTKRILEPSCGQGIFILKLISDVYQLFPDENLISNFIGSNIFFVDIEKEMIEKTIFNIKSLYKYLFADEYNGSFNSIVWDFTDKVASGQSLFEVPRETSFTFLYGTFDYVIGNPPYVTLYGRRDKKQNEEQRINYLKNYNQFPDYVKNGKINLVMLFIEHSLDFLKVEGKLSFIIDVSFFETAYEFTRKYLLEKTRIEELQVNIKDFDVASGQIILKIAKSIFTKDNKVKIHNHKTQTTYFVPQSSWLNKNDEYKFRFNACDISKQIIDRVVSKEDKNLLELFPNKNLRTCVMLLDMENKFTFYDYKQKDEKLVYPYYQGSKALSEKYGNLSFKKYFFYNKSLQDEINDKLKIQLEDAGVKNKKRIGLGETIIYDNPKIYIRQSAKEIVATIDLKRSSANNSLYIFSLRNNSAETISFLYFLCSWLNSELVTYYAQQMNIIRYSQGKQPQIKISDLGSIYIPTDKELQNKISKLGKFVYENPTEKSEAIKKIDTTVYEYYQLTSSEIKNISNSIKAF